MDELEPWLVSRLCHSYKFIIKCVFALFLHQNASRDFLQDEEITLKWPAEACKHLKSGLNKGLAGTCCVKKANKKNEKMMECVNFKDVRFYPFRPSSSSPLLQVAPY